MSEIENRGTRDFSHFDSMETEELEQILRLDAEVPEGEESDTEMLFYVMGVLAERRKKSNFTGKTAQQAWESFQQNYMPKEAWEEPEAKPSAGTAKPWLRRISAAAAVVVLAVLIPVSARALSLDQLWDIFARWAKETFSFVSGESTQVSEPTPDDQDEYSSLQELLLENNIDPNIIPPTVLDGFVLERLEKDITPAQEVYRAFYLFGDRRLTIRVRSYLHGDPENVEISEDLLEIYNHAGIEFYVFSNMEQTRAVWITGSYQCNISGDLSIEELKMMIDSIEEG